jgi:hypothetical protein
MSRQTKASPNDEILLDLEERLAGTLKPIRPSSDVVQRLRERIHFPVREDFTVRLRDWRQVFLVFGGVMSGLLVAITIARALFHLVGRRDM